MRHRSAYLVVLLLGMALFITTCAPLIPAASTPPTDVPPTSTASSAKIDAATSTPTDIPPTTIVFSEKIDVGGYKLRMRCFGQGTPTVIVDASLGHAAVESGSWFAVTSKIAQTTQICLYDRAGVGSSDSAPEQDQPHRTTQDMVKDLHTLLINANVSAPYVLVGHSIGGHNVLLYASQYPQEVTGVVLVDASHPDQDSKVSAVLPPEQPNESEILKAIRSDIEGSTPNPERMDMIASAAQVRAVTSLGDLPLVVLTHTRGWLDPNLPPDLSAKIEQIWQDLQIELAGLSSNSTHIIATKAGHFIQVDEPRLVIDAILKVISQAKK